MNKKSEKYEGLGPNLYAGGGGVNGIGQHT